MNLSFKIKRIYQVDGALFVAGGSYLLYHGVERIAFYAIHHKELYNFVTTPHPLEQKALIVGGACLEALLISFDGLLIKDGIVDLVKGKLHYTLGNLWKNHTRNPERKLKLERAIRDIDAVGEMSICTDGKSIRFGDKDNYYPNVSLN